MIDAHPAAEIFALLGEDKLESLAGDIAEHGLRQPIVLHEGLVLDGRNRLRACELASVEPEFTEFGGTDPVAFVVSCNVQRRHLNSSQRAMAAQDTLPMLEAEAKERQRLSQGPGVKGVELIPHLNEGRARDHAARLFSTNNRYVSDAKVIAAARPDLAEQIRSGDLTIPQVMREIRRAERTEEIVFKGRDLPTGSYPVVYADPPWRYDFAQSSSREIENQYPTMTLEEICDLGVSDLAGEDAVLFLWATTAKLPEALEVLTAWGFEYRTSMVWVKTQIGMGYYARGQHEILLIGARGSLPVPKAENRPPSVLEAPRAAHSAKPAAFRELIEAMYPEHKRVELFAREPAEGWEGWGNQL